MSKAKILFVHPNRDGSLSPFMLQDVAILGEKYEVEVFDLFGRSSTRLRNVLISHRLWRAIARSDLVFGWFGGCAPAFMVAKVLRKPSVLVGGGADIVSIPEINYGITRVPGWRQYIQTIGFRLANRVLLFSDSSKRSAQAILGDGLHNLQTLYLGVDGDYFVPRGDKQPWLLTIGYMNQVSIKRKGIDVFVDAANVASDLHFRLGGKPIDPSAVAKLLTSAPPNLTYLGHLDQGQLLSEYQHARVYVQLSLHEGFGLAIAEAMACECIPVVTEAGSIPEVVGDAGLQVPDTNPVTVAAIMREALKPHNERLGKLARERVIDTFPIARRSRELHAVIESILSQA